MSTEREGGCACAEVRYRLTSEPLFLHCCYGVPGTVGELRLSASKIPAEDRLLAQGVLADIGRAEFDLRHRTIAESSRPLAP